MTKRKISYQLADRRTITEIGINTMGQVYFETNPLVPADRHARILANIRNDVEASQQATVEEAGPKYPHRYIFSGDNENAKNSFMEAISWNAGLQPYDYEQACRDLEVTPVQGATKPGIKFAISIEEPSVLETITYDPATHQLLLYARHRGESQGAENIKRITYVLRESKDGEYKYDYADTGIPRVYARQNSGPRTPSEPDYTVAEIINRLSNRNLMSATEAQRAYDVFGVVSERGAAVRQKIGPSTYAKSA